ALTLSSDITNKGFTGHEQLDGVNLIHMGGRVYDAEIGRFLSADPFVGDSTNLQALNRYSYVENNPLSYTDPSGFFLKKLVKKLGNAIKSGISSVVEGSRNLRRKVLRQIGEIEGLSIVISVALNFIPGCQAWCAMAFNAAMTDANGGTIGQVLTGAAIGMITNGVPGVDGMVGGGVVGALSENIGNMAASMLVAGTVSKAQGGKFIDGAKWAGIGSAIGTAAGGIRNAVNAGATSLGAAMDHIKWALEDAMLPTAELKNGIVRMEEKAPDGNHFVPSGGATVTQGATRFVTMPGFAERHTYTGNLYSSGAGNPSDGASSQATRVLAVVSVVSLGLPFSVQAGVILAPQWHLVLSNGLQSFNAWRNVHGVARDILSGIDDAVPQRVNYKDFSQPKSPAAIERLKDW
ncbi:RHS repeat-associated core domain-containing protein, partial [Zhongshania borealis]|uniref:RHS repeat-associated core domain-containing protein n=1 Tax=Zhongshania borealis TaxID=889488 RepID=UPI0031E6378D